ncbi:uncharacterized protein LOC124265419 [Haliotis rubra]|uniref:uncharacterized protein LOC124265419 n=1 Tax=Haliotis rubra TaxID=36100 RepID=UPI001EE56FFF|nr:uncharacterized protein LOC124265419 [Haliotis rubra]
MLEWRYLAFVLWTGVYGHFNVPRNINTTDHMYVFHETIQADNDAVAHEYTLTLPKGHKLDLLLFDASKANLTAQGLSCEDLRAEATWSHTVEPPRGRCDYNTDGQYGELYKCSGTFSSFGNDKKLYTLAICSHNNNGIRVTDFELLTEDKKEHYDVMVIGILLGSIFLLLLVFFLVFFAMRKCSSVVLYHPEKKKCQISSHTKIPPGQTETEA